MSPRGKEITSPALGHRYLMDLENGGELRKNKYKKKQCLCVGSLIAFNFGVPRASASSAHGGGGGAGSFAAQIFVLEMPLSHPSLPNQAMMMMKYNHIRHFSDYRVALPPPIYT